MKRGARLAGSVGGETHGVFQHDTPGESAHVLGREGLGAINVKSHFRAAPANHVAAKTGRDLHDQGDVMGAQALVDLGQVAQGGVLLEVAGAVEVLDELAAVVALVVVQHGKGHVLNVERDAPRGRDQQDDGPQQRKGQADRVALELHGLAAGEGPHFGEPQGGAVGMGALRCVVRRGA
jgi:hypothetical protein